MSKYRVEYEGQILTEPLDLQEAQWIAIEANIDSYKADCLPLCEVVLCSASED